jgi:hypothetical protein
MEQSNLQISEPAYPQTANEQREMIALLKRQNELLENLQKNLTFSMRREDEQHNTLSTRVVDINMSIGAMIGFMLKWLVASIPVAMIIGFFWVLIVFGLAAAGIGLSSFR